ncbi:hypothetical protein ACGFX2_08740 [Streptomyces goshikiensis]|uniref:hypothetical protein n=1 Tax=Streptomyces goshikiensis TaxID=1942 RepID=UPI00371B2558
MIAVGWTNAEGWMRCSSPSMTRASRWSPFHWSRNAASSNFSSAPYAVVAMAPSVGAVT